MKNAILKFLIFVWSFGILFMLSYTFGMTNNIENFPTFANILIYIGISISILWTYNLIYNHFKLLDRDEIDNFIGIIKRFNDNDKKLLKVNEEKKIEKIINKKNLRYKDLLIIKKISDKIYLRKSLLNIKKEYLKN